MTGRWDARALADCAEMSRRLGADPSLVLHGGGNSSVKSAWRDVTGRDVDAIFVKGTGRDMGSITEEGFAPLRIDRLRELLELEALGDADMMRELSAARLDPAAPQPSVEALLHAFFPDAFVLHSHADAIVSLTNLAAGERVVREVFGDRVVVVPYVMPGFDLARAVRECWPAEAREHVAGLVLLNHGLFTFGETGDEAYVRHLDLLALAERWLEERSPPRAAATPLPDVPLLELARLRRDVSRAAGRPLLLRRVTDPVVRGFSARPDLASLATRGPLTPDHVIRTKRIPMVGRDVDAFVSEYETYFAEHARPGLTMLDPAPRVVVDPQLGVVTAGESADAAQAAADIYLHTIPVLERSEDRLGGYVALPPRAVFDVEYWELEQAKLRSRSAPLPLAGAAAVVTGAASGIGRACAAALLAAGAAVAGLDVSPEVEGAFTGNAWRGVAADVTDAGAVERALRVAVESFGGVDVAVLAAGVFGPSTPLAELAAEDWDAVFAVNARSAAMLLRELHPLLAASPVGGRVAVVASKNVAAPGRAATAYSASKAAITQTCRVAALEWATDGIRVNLVHPDAVFDTGLWTAELLAERAAGYGVDVETYKRRNLLGIEITSNDVAQAVVALCTDTFRATTGAQVPIDGGNERVI